MLALHAVRRALILGITSALAVAVLSSALVVGHGPSAENHDRAFDDQQHMMDQLGIRSLRPGANPNDPTIYDEALANLYRVSPPDAITMDDGTPVAGPGQWPVRREKARRAL